jgi:hypothetical protein
MPARWLAYATSIVLVAASADIDVLGGQTILTAGSPDPASIPALAHAHYASGFSDSVRVTISFRCNSPGATCSFRVEPSSGTLTLQFRLVSRTGNRCGSLPASTIWADLVGSTALVNDLPANNGGNGCNAVFDFKVRDLAYNVHQANVLATRSVQFVVAKN